MFLRQFVPLLCILAVSPVAAVKPLMRREQSDEEVTDPNGAWEAHAHHDLHEEHKKVERQARWAESLERHDNKHESNHSDAVGGCTPATAKNYCKSAIKCKERGEKGCCPHMSADSARMGKLFEVNDHIIGQSWYQDKVDAIITKYPSLSFNHVASPSFYDGNAAAQMLPSTAQVCLRYGKVGGAGKDDITKGIGYYHFNRISVGKNCEPSVNFALEAGKVMYMICPSLLKSRHFIVCTGNIAKNSAADCPGKQEGRNVDKPDKIKLEAEKALAKLESILAGTVPGSNEIAFFGGVPWEHINKAVTPGTSSKAGIVGVECDAQKSVTCSSASTPAASTATDESDVAGGPEGGPEEGKPGGPSGEPESR